MSRGNSVTSLQDFLVANRQFVKLERKAEEEQNLSLASSELVQRGFNIPF